MQFDLNSPELGGRGVIIFKESVVDGLADYCASTVGNCDKGWETKVHLSLQRHQGRLYISTP
jgi:hypothetical protein